MNGIGNRIGTYFIGLAKKEMKRWHISLPDPDLAYFPEDTPLFWDYLEGVRWAQEFARVNRELMMQATIESLDLGHCLVGPAINCHHNFVEKENHGGSNIWVTRKGAMRAREGEAGIIPGSMGTKSFIVEGKGSTHSWQSCSHGAGRVMSRTAARKKFTVEDHVLATSGVDCCKDESVLDETPASYKPIDDVMAAQSDLVEIKHTLKQIACVKG